MQPYHLIEGTAYCDSIDMKQARILQHSGAVGANKIEALYHFRGYRDCHITKQTNFLQRDI